MRKGEEKSKWKVRCENKRIRSCKKAEKDSKKDIKKNKKKKGNE